MVWYSNAKSLKNGEISFLAIVEIFIAISIYWIPAIYFDVYLHILISILLSPFLLLRSKKSIKMGLSLFENGVRSKREYTPVYRFLFEMILLANLIIITYILFVQFLNIDDVIFVLIFLLFCSGIGIGMGLGLFGVMDNQRIGILSILSVFITSIYLGGLNILVLIISMLLLSVIISTLFKKNGKILLGIIAGTFLGLGVALGFLLIVFIYKLIAIMSNFICGYKNIIENWKYNNFILDIKHTPELMFGIENYEGLDEFKLSKFFDELKMNNDMIESFATTATYLILYPFALLYRYSIKATFWFYIPLLILVKTPQNLDNTIDVKDFLSKLHRYTYVKFFFWAAFIMLCIFLLNKLNPTFLEQWNNPFSMYMSVIYIDFSSTEVWKLLQVLLALLTIILYFWSDFIWKKNENRGINFTQYKQIKYMFFTNNIKNVMLFLYLSFLFLYMSYEFEIWNYKYIPNSLEAFLSNMMKIIQYKLF